MIMSYKQFLRSLRRKTREPFEPGNIFDPGATRAAELLCEGGRSYDLRKGYHCRFDRAHVSGQDDHLYTSISVATRCALSIAMAHPAATAW